MNRFYAATICMLASAAGIAGAQELTGGAASGPTLTLNPDTTLTVRFPAPEAVTVTLTGLTPDSISLTKGPDGIWSAVTPKLKPDLYTYSLCVDGVKTTDSTNPYYVRDVTNVSNELIIPGGNADMFLTHDVPHGSVSKVWYHSPTLGTDRRMTIYTPPGYESGTGSYPVLYLLHGMGGDEEAWSQLGRAVEILDNMIARGEATPMIVVMPNGNADRTAAPGYTSDGLYLPEFGHSVSAKDKFESSFADIKNYVDSNYRTRPGKADSAIAGLSMGGGHAWRISQLMPDTFDYVGMFSPAIGWNGHGVDEITPESSGAIARQMADSPRLYWIGIGKDDFLYGINKDYRKYLDDHGYAYDYHESPGGHTWTNWRDYLLIFASRIFK